MNGAPWPMTSKPRLSISAFSLADASAMITCSRERTDHELSTDALDRRLFFRSDDGIVVVVKGSTNAMAAPKLMTVDEYLRTPETVLPAELRFGVLRVAESPTPRHQSAVARIFRMLDGYVATRGLGEVWLAPLDVILDEQRALIVQPDLMFISNEKACIVGDRVRGAPDLMVEVLSPNPRIGKTEERVSWFAEYGVRECWLVHLDRRELTVITCANRRIATRVTFGHRHSICSSVFPDFTESFDHIMGRTPNTER
jgi:Uma2 family endonuclease